ncbi:hypothetical protein BASA83_013710 [Batrachochytrium salamandrivorans]|nr:hypothetical protein BASA83_013710 [Batrachochytrium salamandrivorans]
MLLFDRNFIMVSAVKSRMLWYISIILSVSAAMDMAIRIDNRLFERRQEQRLNHQQPSSSYSPATPSISCFKNQQQQQQIFFKPRQPAIKLDPTLYQLPSARPLKKSKTIIWISTCAQRSTIS